MAIGLRQFARLLALSLVLFGLGGALPPARADLADKVLQFVKEKGGYIGINADSVELTIYAYHEPSYAAELFGRAVAQDYPLFALVGAVKAVKGKKLPGIGTFTEAKCLTPITAIDAIFGKADSYIDDAKGKEDTNAAVGLAKDYAADYAKSVTAEAKEEVKSKLAEEVPYFGDIPMICNFAFNTDLEAERNLQKIMTKTVKDLVVVYKHFKNKEIVKGTKKLIAMGFDTDLACEIADDGLKSAGVGKIPGVSELTNGICKGFVGKVVGAVADGAKAAYEKGKEIAEDGAEAVADGGCAVLDLFGACNPDIPAPPPSGLKNANAFCAGNGGLASYNSPNNAPNDFAVTCNNGAMCAVKPGKPAVCVTAEQHAAFEADRVASNQKAVANYIANYPEQFDKEFILPCPDKKCEIAEKVVLSAIIPKMKAIAAANPSWSAGEVETDSSISELKQQARNILKTAKQKFAAETQEAAAETTYEAAAAYEKLQIAKWSKQCPSKDCTEGVVAIAAEMRKQMISYQKQHPELGSSAVTGTIGKKYAKLFQQMIDSAKAVENEQAAADTTFAAAAGYEKLQIAKWSKQCPSNDCKEGVVAIAGEMKKQMISYQKQHPELGSSEVTGTVGKKYAKLFKQLIDSANKEAAAGGAANAAATGDDASDPGSLGCNKYLGRGGQWLCPDQKGFRACVALVKAGSAQFCATGNLFYGDTPTTIRNLKIAGCVQQGDGLAFACRDAKGLAACEKFKNGRMPVRCDG